MHSTHNYAVSVSLLKDLRGLPATDHWSNVRKKRVVYVFKANNKFLLISFDNLKSDLICFRIQTKSLSGEEEEVFQLSGL